jgi:hypothetical protein
MRSPFGLKLKTTTAVVALLSAQLLSAAPASSTTAANEPEDLDWLGAPSASADAFAPKSSSEPSLDFIDQDMDDKISSTSSDSKKKNPLAKSDAKKSFFGDDDSADDDLINDDFSPASSKDTSSSKDLDSLFAKPSAKNGNKKNFMSTAAADDKFAKDDETTYTVIIKTGDRFGSGTNSHVFVQFGDGQGNAVNSFLSSRGHFTRKKVDAFKIKSGVYLDEVCQMVVGHDNSHLYAPWYVTLLY